MKPVSLVRLPPLRSRQVNLLLAVAVGGLLLTGVVSWSVGTGWSRWWTVMHGVFGFAVLVLTPMKSTTSVKRGLKRRRSTRWLSILLAVLVLGAIALGVAHSTGVWRGHGYWSPLWTHFLVAFAAMPIVVWHVASRPTRPRPTDLDRRLLLGAGARLAVSGVILLTVEGAVRAASLDGASRRFTGSYPIGSFDPDRMPTVSWIDDTAPEIVDDSWPLQVAGVPMTIAALRERVSSVEATLDCTGGWYSTQRWDAISLAELLGPVTQRSLMVTSATGFRRLVPASEADRIYLAVGYDGRPLRRGHGAPARLVVPGRRGPWWVKWVVSVEPDDRPSWLQLPFPAT